jgi:hypothetical protein
MSLITPPEETTSDETDIESGSEVEPSCELSFNTSFIGFAARNSSANDGASANTHLDTANENPLSRDNIVNIVDGTPQTRSSYDNLHDNGDSENGESGAMTGIRETGWYGGMRWVWACLGTTCTCLKVSED